MEVGRVGDGMLSPVASAYSQDDRLIRDSSMNSEILTQENAIRAVRPVAGFYRLRYHTTRPVEGTFTGSVEPRTSHAWNVFPTTRVCGGDPQMRTVTGLFR